MLLTLDNNGLDFIKKWESCKLIAYRDVAGIWTIGWGTIRYANGIAVKKGDKITQSVADFELNIECNGIRTRLKNIIKVELNQNQFNAITSFCYNIGVQGFKTSTLLRELNNDRVIKEDYFTRWNKAHVDGKLVPIKGLTNRRRAEFKLFER